MRSVVTNHSWALGLAMLAAGALGGCAAEIGAGEDPSPQASELDRAFARAGAEHGVPAVLLQAVAWSETRWEMIVGDAEHDGAPGRVGAMGVRQSELARGAALAGVDPAAVASELEANLAVGAALLAAEADALDVARVEGGFASTAELAAWAPAVARYGGLDGEAAAAYVHDEVYAALRTGVVLEDERGIVGALRAVAVEADFPAPLPPTVATVDYAGALWRGSPNHDARRGSGDVELVVIHSCEGNYASCWSWLTSEAAASSAHYVVGPDGEVSQLVRESEAAWHIAAEYDCARNGDVGCARNGESSNDFSIGIEHGGFASQRSWPTTQLEASARLACDVARDHGLPLDRFHIVGHGQLQPWNRRDPGAGWPWSRYLERIAAHCGAGGGAGSGAPTIVVDSNNSSNDTQLAYAEMPASWAPSASVAGYYGSGYLWSHAAAADDGATFWFHLDAGGTRTIDAWWPAASDRAAATPFVVLDSAGRRVATVTRDQRRDGERWNQLGSYALAAGWNRVVVSRRAGSGVVVADAIRVR